MRLICVACILNDDDLKDGDELDVTEHETAAQCDRCSDMTTHYALLDP